MKYLEQIKFQQNLQIADSNPRVVFIGHCFSEYMMQQCLGKKPDKDYTITQEEQKKLLDKFKLNGAFTEVGLFINSLVEFAETYTCKNGKDKSVKELLDQNKQFPFDDQAIAEQFLLQKGDKVVLVIGGNDVQPYYSEPEDRPQTRIRPDFMDNWKPETYKDNFEKTIKTLRNAGVEVFVIGENPPSEGSRVYDGKGVYMNIKTQEQDWNEINADMKKIAEEYGAKFIQPPKDVGQRDADGWHYKDYRSFFKFITNEVLEGEKYDTHPLRKKVNDPNFIGFIPLNKILDSKSQEVFEKMSEYCSSFVNKEIYLKNPEEINNGKTV